MARKTIFVLRALPEHVTEDGTPAAGATNTKLVRDVIRDLYLGFTAQQLQDARHDDDPSEPTFALLTVGQLATLNARIGAIASAAAAYVPPVNPGPFGKGGP